MRLHPRLVLLALLALTTTACVAPGADVPEAEGTGGLQAPTFSPLATDAPTSTGPSATSTTSPTSSPAAASPVGSDAEAGSPDAQPTTSRTSPATTAPPAVATVRGSLSDGTGDLSGLNRSRAPGHADLRGAVLEMGAERGTIRIEFAAPAPEQGEGDEILNVATYHDVTGDGRVDHEIWASLTSDGWGTSWYDLGAGTARFAADDEVDVTVDDGALVLTFPASHLDDARSGQWLASSEWGTGLMMSTGTTVTDDAPDDRSGRRWPD